MRAVAAQAAGLDPLIEERPLARPEEALEPAPVRLAVGRGQDQLREVAAQGFRSGPPEDRLRPRVPERDRPLLRHADDRIQGGVENGPHLGRGRAQPLFGTVALRIAGGARDPVAEGGQDGHRDALDGEEAEPHRLVGGGTAGGEEEDVAGDDGEARGEEARTDSAPPARCRHRAEEQQEGRRLVEQRSQDQLDEQGAAHQQHGRGVAVEGAVPHPPP